MDRRQFAELAVRLYHSLLNANVRVDGIILFGSQARGTATEESDIDLAVISRDFGKDRIAEGALVNIHAHRIHPKAEAIPVALGEFLGRLPISPVVHEIKKEGIFLL